MSYIYTIKYCNNIIGIYDSYDLAYNYIISLLQNNLINNISNNIIIYKYILNAGHYIETIKFKNNDISELLNKKKKYINNIIKSKCDNKTIKIQNNNTIKSNYDEETIKIQNDNDLEKNIEIIDNINKNKIEIQHDINMLNQKKEKILESKQVYDNDIKLYNLFNTKIINEPNFIIPELFNDKYNIFKKLDLENRLSWDTYILESNNDINNYNNYFVENDYEKKINISEDIIIDSE